MIVFVYMIGQSPDMKGLVKIGTTSNLTHRLASLQCGSPVPLQVVWSVPGDAALERHLHRALMEYRKHGEWFDLGSDPIGVVVEQVYRHVRSPGPATTGAKRGSKISPEDAYEVFLGRVEDRRIQGRSFVEYADFADLLHVVDRSRSWVYSALNRASDEKILSPSPDGGAPWIFVTPTDTGTGEVDVTE